jgi:cytochrome c oxidase cbb3-type subunit II
VAHATPRRRLSLDLHRNHRALFAVITLGFITLSIVVAVAPATWMQDRIAPLPGSSPPTPEERAGLAVYLAEGCAYCHTQQVRPLPEDKQFGRPSAPADYARLGPLDLWRQTPEVLGTERTGPDLSDIGHRQASATWHYLHLYEPRALVPVSVMPRFPWLFETKAKAESADVVVPVPAPYALAVGTIVATPAARHLIAYLLGLKQASLGTSAEPAPGTSATAADDIYKARCAGCHQATGAGVAGAFPPLARDPVVIATDPARHIAVVLNGLQGGSIGGVRYPGAMPPWADQLSDSEVAAVIDLERTSWGNRAPTVTAADVARARQRSTR